MADWSRSLPSSLRQKRKRTSTAFSRGGAAWMARPTLGNRSQPLGAAVEPHAREKGLGSLKRTAFFGCMGR